jgi:hypothetical protein
LLIKKNFDAPHSFAMSGESGQWCRFKWCRFDLTLQEIKKDSNYKTRKMIVFMICCHKMQKELLYVHKVCTYLLLYGHIYEVTTQAHLTAHQHQHRQRYCSFPPQISLVSIMRYRGGFRVKRRLFTLDRFPKQQRFKKLCLLRKSVVSRKKKIQNALFREMFRRHRKSSEGSGGWPS